MLNFLFPVPGLNSVPDGSAFEPSCQRYTGCPGKGSTNTNVLRWSTNRINQGSDIQIVQSAENGDAFKVLTAGVYSISAQIYNYSSGTTVFQIRAAATLNNLANYTETDMLSTIYIPNNEMRAISTTVYLPANTLIWIVSDRAVNNGVPGLNQVLVCRVA